MLSTEQDKRSVVVVTAAALLGAAALLAIVQLISREDPRDDFTTAALSMESQLRDTSEPPLPATESPRRKEARSRTPIGKSPSTGLAPSQGSPITGRVVDSDGTPVPATVHLVAVEDSMQLLEHGTDGSGLQEDTDIEAPLHFEFEDVPHGDYQLVVQARGWLQEHRLLSHTDATLVELRLQGDLVQGRLEDEQGRPIPDGRVALLPGGSSLTHESALRDLLRFGVPATAQGEFALRGDARDAMLVATAPDRTLAFRTKFLEARDLVLTLHSAVDLRGEVYLDTGRPVSNAVIQVEALRLMSSRASVRRTVVDAHGAYELAGLAIGEYRITALTGSLRKPRTLHLTAEASTVDFCLRGVPSTRIQVHDERGRPIAGSTVRFERAASQREGPNPLRTELVGGVSTTRDGTAEILGLEDGLWLVRATVDEAELDSALVRLPRTSKEPVQLKAHPKGRLDVQVVDSAGIPVPDAILRATWSNPAGFRDTRVYRTDANGHASCDGLSPGTHDVALDPLVAGVSVERVGRSVQVRASTTTRTSLVVPPSFLLNVLVNDRGAPAPRALVAVARPNDLNRIDQALLNENVRTDTRGRCQLVVDRSVPFLVLVRARVGAVPTTVLIEPSSQEPTVRVDLPAGRVSGVVTDHNGAPLLGAQVHLIPDTLPHVGSWIVHSNRGQGLAPPLDPTGVTPRQSALGEALLLSSDDGSFAFEHVPSGTYGLRVVQPGFGALHVETLSIEGPSTAWVDAELEPRADLTVVLTGLSGEEAPRVAAHLLDASGERLRWSSFNANGKVRFEDLTAGEYQVAIVRGGHRYVMPARVVPGSENACWIDWTKVAPFESETNTPNSDNE